MSDTLEHRYYKFLQNQEYSDAAFLRQVLSVYLPYFAGAAHVLDIGCGRGEFLEMLAAAGHEAVGLDVDPAMVQTCLDRGLNVYQADVLEWLPDRTGEFDGIFSSNVMEHLAAPRVLKVVDACYAALKPGGVLLIAVPNPESLIVQLHEYWRDATHVRLYNRQLLEFFFFDAGFDEVQSFENREAVWTPANLGGAPMPGIVPEVEITHIPPLPKPLRRVAWPWETLRAELSLIREWLYNASRWMQVLQQPYATSREVFVVGRKPVPAEAAP